MGLGKSVITLTAIKKLMLDSFEVSRTLVIAPASTTWPEEIRKWEHLKPLTYSVVTGGEKKRLQALRTPAHIYIINRENVDWLVTKSGVPFHFDMGVIDELSGSSFYISTACREGQERRRAKKASRLLSCIDGKGRHMITLL